MRIEISTPLEAPARRIWQTLQNTESLRYVAKPLLCFRGNLPRRWPGRGGVVRVERMMLLCVVPAWSHELRIVHFDEEESELATNAHGGPVREWNHRIKVQPLSE